MDVSSPLDTEAKEPSKEEDNKEEDMSFSSDGVSIISDENWSSDEDENSGGEADNKGSEKEGLMPITDQKKKKNATGLPEH